MLNQFVLFATLLSTYTIIAQLKPTSSQVIESTFGNLKQMEANSLVKHMRLKNIGPSIMSGRVVDIDVNADNPIEFYVGYASGGLWYTDNNGTSFTPVLDNSPTQNIGDIAVDWTTGTIWVGTGESNASRSSYAGIGVLRSDDKGKTWQHMGLTDTHHIGQMLLNPENSNEILVGATGHLYSNNKERGVYKSSDGGTTWRKTLFINDQTGIIDMANVPNNFEIVYAAAWEKDRKAWDFLGNGSSSGIYKSIDGGDSWTKVSVEGSGFPTGVGVGRIGLAVVNENTVYALLDNQDRREASEEGKGLSRELNTDDFKSMSREEFLALDDKKLNSFLKTNGFQEKYRAENVKQMVRSHTIKPADVAHYLKSANAMLFETPVIGPEVYRSDDGGMSWHKQNTEYIDDFFYSYGYYFGKIWVDPNNSDKIYLGGVPLIASDNGGQNFVSIDGDNVHADHHALWVNPKRPGHLINGNDGGINISYDDGASWIKNNSPSVGQFYTINVDNQGPYHVYGGLQDNGVWEGPHDAKEDNRWHQTGDYPWKSLLGGDGMQVQIDSRNHNIVYTGYQFGNYYRINKEEKKRKYIQPKHDLGDLPFRFNWQTPIVLSPHNQDIVYIGSHRLHRSMNQGDQWETISEDLTQGGKKGNVSYGTLTTLSESPFKFGLLYTGSDDGLIHVTQDGGGNWLKISEALPNDMWVSRVVASRHKKERVYAVLNGYRWDDFTPYIYKSNDYGRTWKNIGANIPNAPVNTILEDTENENLLFAGTDNGLYVTFDQGNHWEAFQNGLPRVAVHDLIIQPRAKHLLVATHGRSIYRADIALLQEITPEILNLDLHLFDVRNIKYSDDWGNPKSPWAKPDTPGLDLTFYCKKAGRYTAKIQTLEGIVVSATEVDADKGLNVISYDLAFSKAGKASFLKKNKVKLKKAKDGKTYLPKGTYTIELKGQGSSKMAEFKIE